MNNDKIDLVHRRKSEPGKWKHQWAKKNTRIEIKFQFPLRSSVSLNLAGFYWKNVCLEYWPLWHSHYTLTLTVTAGPLPVIRKYFEIGSKFRWKFLLCEKGFFFFSSLVILLVNVLHVYLHYWIMWLHDYMTKCPIKNTPLGNNTILHLFVNTHHYCARVTELRKANLIIRKSCFCNQNFIISWC